MKTGRNAPCHCGSGKKYKKCCLKTEVTPPPEISDELLKEAQELDDLSNSVIDLIQEQRLAEAEKVCQRLLDEYPQLVDGIMRFAEVYEAKGDWQQAAAYYRKTAEFMDTHEGFDPESRLWHLDQAIRIEKEQGL